MAWNEFNRCSTTRQNSLHSNYPHGYNWCYLKPKPRSLSTAHANSKKPCWKKMQWCLKDFYIWIHFSLKFCKLCWQRLMEWRRIYARVIVAITLTAWIFHNCYIKLNNWYNFTESLIYSLVGHTHYPHTYLQT